MKCFMKEISYSSTLLLEAQAEEGTDTAYTVVCFSMLFSTFLKKELTAP